MLMSPQVTTEMGSFVVGAATCCTILIGKGTVNVLPTKMDRDGMMLPILIPCAHCSCHRHMLVFLKGCLWVTPPLPCSVIITSENVSGSAHVFLIL